MPNQQRGISFAPPREAPPSRLVRFAARIVAGRGGFLLVATAGSAPWLPGSLGNADGAVRCAEIQRSPVLSRRATGPMEIAGDRAREVGEMAPVGAQFHRKPGNGPEPPTKQGLEGQCLGRALASLATSPGAIPPSTASIDRVAKF